MKSVYWTLAAGLALIVPAYCGLMITPVPTLICPFPSMTIIPAFVLSSSPKLGWLATLVPVLLFFGWIPRLFSGLASIPRRSLALLVVFTILAIIYFAGSWKYGLKYQGSQFTYAVCGVNAAWLLLLWIVFVFGWRRPSFQMNLLAHWLLFVWLAWYAFPYLGELP